METLRLTVRDAIQEYFEGGLRCLGDPVEVTCDIADKVFEALGISPKQQDIEGAVIKVLKPSKDKSISMTKKSKVYVIQENIGGTSYDPVVFTELRKANKHYIKLVNEVHSTNFKSIGETVDYMKKNNGEYDHEILYWTTKVE